MNNDQMDTIVQMLEHSILQLEIAIKAISSYERNKIPNKETLKAIQEADSGKTHKAKNIEEIEEFAWDIDPSLGCRVRIENCLRYAEIKNLNDLCKCSEKFLFSIPNMGKKSIKAIKDCLGSKGLRLGMTEEELGERNEI